MRERECEPERGESIIRFEASIIAVPPGSFQHLALLLLIRDVDILYIGLIVAT